VTELISGRPGRRPFVACGSYVDKNAAETAARELSSETQAWKAVPIESPRSNTSRLYAIRRTS
jgi:hypothetical protein